MTEWTWKGNLRDDCHAIGHGLMLRAEMMDKGEWWWDVFHLLENDSITSSELFPAKTGKEARAAAEKAANQYLERVEAFREWRRENGGNSS